MSAATREVARRPARAFAAALALALLGAAGCGGDALKCASGTVAKAGRCVPAGAAVACGPGTHAEGGVCVVDGADAGGDGDTGADVADTSGDADGSGDTGDTDDGAPACVPACAGRQCGDDGCGSSCGSCDDPKAPVCGDLGVCVAFCKPECSGKSCGPDGCGGSCGACEAGICSAYGQCVPPAWTCSKLLFSAGDACDCGCGAVDPDCQPGVPVVGCGTLESCDDKGACASKVPAGWTCLPTAFDALDACDCGCGVDDPDCAIASLPVQGCQVGEACGAGVCQACTPACKDKSCGPDGCGGSCGSCANGQVCDVGQCVAPCTPTPVACKKASCGDDGCGGSCGSCPAGESCDGGHCAPVPLPEAPTSCVNHCGSTALSGCACTAACAESGSCCEDYQAVCSCKPECQGKSCGDDGCGGACGVCAAGTTCAWSSQCVPDAWQCPVGYFNDGTACDCGCGAVDPDCAGGKLKTFGCPSPTTACDPGTGLCQSTFCKGDAACPGQTCVGVYANGGGVWAGVCGAQTSGGKLIGQPCQSHAECKGAVCLGGQCRGYCQGDGDCPSAQRCLGVAVHGSLGDVVGFAGVCDAPGGSLLPCAAQADCKLLGEAYRAFVDAKTLGPRLLCAKGSKASGASCALEPCAGGQLCVSGAKGSFCAAVCPAGAADCSVGSCGSAALHNAGTKTPDDDPKVPACLP